MTHAIRDAVACKILHNLPGSVTPPPGESGRVTAINNLTSEIMMQHAAAAQRAIEATTKTSSQYFGHGTLILNRITHTRTPNELPPIWFDIAKGAKRTVCTTIDECFWATADDLGMPSLSPITTPASASKLTGCCFGQENIDDLEEVIHPFLTTFQDFYSLATLKASIQAYDDATQGVGASLSDLAQIRAAEKVGIPTTTIQVLYSFKSFKIMLHTLLPSDHMLTKEYDAFLRSMLRQEAYLDRLMVNPANGGMIICWVQIWVSNWFQDQMNNTSHLPPSDLCRLVTLIHNDEPWATALPPQYIIRTPAPSTLFASPHPPPGAMASPGLPFLPLPGGTSPPGPRAPPGQPGQNPGSGRGERCLNVQYDTQFSPFKDLALPVKDIWDKARAAGKPVPSNATGMEFCLSYHVLGFCWSNCSKSADHAAPVAADSAKLLAWCSDCWRQGGPTK
jgi:hypothetical protein